MKKVLSILTYILIIIFIISYFYKGKLAQVNNVTEATYNDPIQTEVKSNNEIDFTGDGFEYKATPLYDYTVTGIVVSKKNYNTLGSKGIDKSVPYDLCIVWGNNVKEKTYLSSIKFKQDQRFCFYHYSQNASFYPNQLSNNHLLISDDSVFKAEKAINIGDEVQIKGRLVNVIATKTDGSKKYFTWNTSTERTDSGAGACEVIYTESINILHRANPIASYSYALSLYSLFFVVFVRFALFVTIKDVR